MLCYAFSDQWNQRNHFLSFWLMEVILDNTVDTKECYYYDAVQKPVKLT